MAEIMLPLITFNNIHIDYSEANGEPIICGILTNGSFARIKAKKGRIARYGENLCQCVWGGEKTINDDLSAS